ncbi:hypothetical protein NKR19_g1270 [Coniochaeta hoffmannii]|uniref:N-acetyltransferase domain-containing protein n=1 Tax=Coniochaeta hoffmannii TaxID=91930 RepID=A0AA38SCP3_9PEZI|nr:hypothetical protein NKR19_g1270 [Coniochaeta hoffmannii]
MSPKYTVDTFPPSSIPPHLLTRLNAHLPFSLTVLRRIQVACRKKGGSSAHSHIIYVHDGGSHSGPCPFAAAYLDLSRGPETECWIYSTLQDAVPPNRDPTSSDALAPAGLSPEAGEVCVQQVLRLLRRIRAIESVFASASADGSGSEEGLNRGHSRAHVRVGALHETVHRALVDAGVRVKATSVVPVGQEWEFYSTWLIRVENLKAGDEVDLPEGMRWDVLRGKDTALVKSRTTIPKRDDTMLMVPSTVIRRQDGTPVAWGYLGVDGSVSTLHVEEPYRGRGLAKALTGRLLRTRLQELGDDGWCSTDISTTNSQSQGVFRSIGGKPAWTVSWMYVDLATVGEPL